VTHADLTPAALATAPAGRGVWRLVPPVDGAALVVHADASDWLAALARGPLAPEAGAA
jgi:hypothetical protein